MASSSNNIPPFKYDVFISFRGEDARNNFVSHLHEKLREKGIKAYKDDADLERGDEISGALKKAIETSKMSIIIFSKDYASSSWCLDELVHILECREKYKQMVLPVFYDIDPSHVRQQKASYESAFAMHEERLGNKTDEVKKWRDALRAAANLAGWDSRVIRDESDLVERIVEDILSKMNHAPSSDDFKGLVGIPKRFEQIKSLLCTSSVDDVWKVGIWGSGGIGKTTLAQVVFDRLSYKFESICFLANVREEWGKGHKHALKEKLFSELLKEKHPNLGTLSMGSTYDKDRLCSKKVLIVLDDVDDSEQLEFLVEDYIWFGSGSRIIITTRDMQVLRGEVDVTYKAERLNNEEALQLFQSNAFKRTPPTEELLHLSERVINYSEGSPLALKVLGSFLRGKKPENWKEELNKLKECPHHKIQSLLRISFDGLDRMQQCVFLDIACFFKGLHREYAERVLDACGLFPKLGIDDLIDKSLITIKDDNILWMHDLIQEMGWEIEKSSKELSRRSRLWNPEDVYHVLKTNIGTAAIEGMVLDMSNISEVHFHPAAFQNLNNLRFFKIFYSSNLKTCEKCIPRLRFLPDSLRYLHWDGYPWKSFPSNFSAPHLVELILPDSKVDKLWKGNQVHLGSLKKIDLGYSKYLTMLPDLSRASKLEHVYLEYCTSLRQVPSYFQHLNELKTLFLDGCSSIYKFPKLSKNIVCLALSRTAIDEVPVSSIKHLSCLEILSLDYCMKLQSLPRYISKMKSLKAVTFEGTPVLFRYLRYIFPWWIENVFTFSQLSTYRFEIEGNFRFFLHPRPKLKSVPELPLVGIYQGMHMHVLLASVRFGVPRDNYLSARRREFLLYNCLQLYGRGVRDSKMTYLRKLKFLSKKIALQEFASHGLPTQAGIGVCCLAGIEIPNWFNYQFSQPSATDRYMEVVIELPPNSLNSSFLGFAVCASVETNGVQQVNLVCKPYFIMNDGCNLTWDLNYSYSVFRHLGRKFEEDWLIAREKITKVAFVFSLSKNTADNDGWSVKKCGIHLLYEEDANKFGVNQEDWKALEEEEEEEEEEEYG